MLRNVQPKEQRIFFICAFITDSGTPHRAFPTKLTWRINKILRLFDYLSRIAPWRKHLRCNTNFYKFCCRERPAWRSVIYHLTFYTLHLAVSNFNYLSLSIKNAALNLSSKPHFKLIFTFSGLPYRL